MKIENQLTKLFEKYPHLKNQPATISEIMIEDEINGDKACFKLFVKRIQEQPQKDVVK